MSPAELEGIKQLRLEELRLSRVKARAGRFYENYKSLQRALAHMKFKNYTSIHWSCPYLTVKSIRTKNLMFETTSMYTKISILGVK